MSKSTPKTQAPASAVAPAPIKKGTAKQPKQGLTDLARAAIKKIIEKATSEYSETPYPTFLFGKGAESSELVLLNERMANPTEFKDTSVRLDQWNGQAAIVFAKCVETGAIIGRGPTHVATSEEAFDDRPAAEALVIELKKAGVAHVDLVPEVCSPPKAEAKKPELKVVTSATAAAPVEAPKTQTAPAPETPPATEPKAPEMSAAMRANIEQQIVDGLRHLGISTRGQLIELAQRGGILGKATEGEKAERAPKGEGVLDVLAQLVQRPEGCTQKEAHAELVKRFPDRAADSMLSTVKVQLGGKGDKAGARLAKDRKLAITAKEDEKRGGLVLTGKPLTK